MSDDMTDAQNLPPVPEVAIEAAQRIVTDFDTKLPRAFDALIVARAYLDAQAEIEQLRAERDAGLESLRDQLVARRASADEIERLRAAHDERLWVVRNDIRREAFEEAAKVCERLNGGRIGWAVGAELDEAAAAIRALKENT